MNHAEFARLLKSNGFAVSVKSLKNYAETGDDSGFPYHLRLWLEDYAFEDGQWTLDMGD